MELVKLIKTSDLVSVTVNLSVIPFKIKFLPYASEIRSRPYCTNSKSLSVAYSFLISYEIASQPSKYIGAPFSEKLENLNWLVPSLKFTVYFCELRYIDKSESKIATTEKVA